MYVDSIREKQQGFMCNATIENLIKCLMNVFIM